MVLQQWDSGEEIVVLHRKDISYIRTSLMDLMDLLLWPYLVRIVFFFNRVCP